MLASVAAVIILLVFAVRYTRRVNESLTSAPPPPPAGEKVSLQFVKNPVAMPELTVQDLDGRTISTKGLHGKVTLINFWATWCPPCREEIPALIKLQDEYRDQLQIIGVSEDEGPAEMVKKFAAEHHMNYPVVMQTDELRRAFPGVFALPTTFVLDRQARTVQKHVGLINTVTYEHETRALAGLPINAAIETVEDTGQVLLANAAQATEIPGVDLSKLSPAQKTMALKRLNSEGCSCGCQLTVAQCRVNDASCGISPALAQKIVEEVTAN